MENTTTILNQSNPFFDLEATLPIWRQFFAVKVATSLYLDRKNYRIAFLDNDTSIPLLTSDQPIINTYGVNKQIHEKVADLEFYYPLNPQLAILLTRKAQMNRPANTALSEADVTRYNQYIVVESYKQVYSTSRTQLENHLR